MDETAQQTQSIEPKWRRLAPCSLVAMAVVMLAGCNLASNENLPIDQQGYTAIEIGTKREVLERMFGPGEELSLTATKGLFGELEAETFQSTPEKDLQGLKWATADFSLVVLLVEGRVVAKAEQGDLRLGEGIGLNPQ